MEHEKCLNYADFRAIRHHQFRTVNRLDTSRYRECVRDRSRHVKCTETIECRNHRFTNARAATTSTHDFFRDVF